MHEPVARPPRGRATSAVVFGLHVGVGYLASMTLNIAVNPNFPHPFRYTLLNAPHFVAGSIISSVLLVLIG